MIKLRIKVPAFGMFCNNWNLKTLPRVDALGLLSDRNTNSAGNTPLPASHHILRRQRRKFRAASRVWPPGDIGGFHSGVGT